MRIIGQDGRELASTFIRDRFQPNVSRYQSSVYGDGWQPGGRLGAPTINDAPFTNDLGTPARSNRFLPELTQDAFPSVAVGSVFAPQFGIVGGGEGSGEVGPPGPTGPQGPQGPPGDIATVLVDETPIVIDDIESIDSVEVLPDNPGGPILRFSWTQLRYSHNLKRTELDPQTVEIALEGEAEIAATGQIDLMLEECEGGG